MMEHCEQTEESLARLRGPIDIYIGSKTSPEIAVSVMAEMLQSRMASFSQSLLKWAGENHLRRGSCEPARWGLCALLTVGVHWLSGDSPAVEAVARLRRRPEGLHPVNVPAEKVFSRSNESGVRRNSTDQVRCALTIHDLCCIFGQTFLVRPAFRTSRFDFGSTVEPTVSMHLRSHILAGSFWKRSCQCWRTTKSGMWMGGSMSCN